MSTTQIAGGENPGYLSTLLDGAGAFASELLAIELGGLLKERREEAGLPGTVAAADQTQTLTDNTGANLTGADQPAPAQPIEPWMKYAGIALIVLVLLFALGVV